jgi:hypothetical protein
MHKSQSLFNLTTALHVSGVTITHLQEHKTTVTTAYGNRYTVLLTAAIVERVATDLSVLWVAYAGGGGRGRAGRPDNDQQHCYHHTPKVKLEAATAVVVAPDDRRQDARNILSSK